MSYDWSFYDAHNSMRVTCPAGSFPYVIQRGDTLYGLAQRFGTTVSAIQALNPGVTPELLFIGREICIPGGSTCNGILHTVQTGESFFIIARQYGITVNALQSANPGINPNTLRIGQSICVPVTPPQILSTPCSFVLRPNIPALPPAAEIPTGAVVTRKLAMSTYSYTAVTTALPNPRELGNFDTYVAVMNLFSGDVPPRPEAIIIRLTSSMVGTQPTTWAGTTISVDVPVANATAEIRPYNSATNTLGAIILLSGSFANCRQ